MILSGQLQSKTLPTERIQDAQLVRHLLNYGGDHSQKQTKIQNNYTVRIGSQKTINKIEFPNDQTLSVLRYSLDTFSVPNMIFNIPYVFIHRCSPRPSPLPFIFMTGITRLDGFMRFPRPRESRFVIPHIVPRSLRSSKEL